MLFDQKRSHKIGFGKRLGDRLFSLTVTVVVVKIRDRHPILSQLLTSSRLWRCRKHMPTWLSCASGSYPFDFPQISH
ncbi:MAG: hypothetical protein RMZ69_31050 [Nostoc sp. ChiQUE01a]|nr:hypothetical protein [Nostoc sp. ChiQUE01a]